MLRFISLAPTKRECILIAILILVFSSLSRAGNGIWKSRTAVPKSVKYHPHLHDVLIPPAHSEHWRTRVSWATDQVMPPTTIVAHAAGCTIFDNLFVLNGTLFVVTDDSESVPDPKYILSTGLMLSGGDDAFKARLPTEREFRIITVHEAQELFGSGVDVVDGTTWILNDPPQYIQHYYHWTAEVFFAFWRTYSSLDPTISPEGLSWLPALHRIWFTHTDAYHWRDYASMNQLVLRGVFPSATAEYSPDWLDRVNTGRPIILDRVILTDRSAMHNGKNCGRVFRPTAESLSLPGSAHWWSIIRGAITSLSGLDAVPDQESKPVITYVSRQEWKGRKLVQEDHERLVEELYKLRDQHGVEVNVVSMHTLTQAEQIKLAARTTIMMGVHGNGLTSLAWMKPTPETTVMEFFIPGGFTRDYQYTAYGLGLKHYGVWNDTMFTDPDLPQIRFPEGFHGNNIPVDGEAVAKLCLERLRLSAN